MSYDGVMDFRTVQYISVWPNRVCLSHFQFTCLSYNFLSYFLVKGSKVESSVSALCGKSLVLRVIRESWGYKTISYSACCTDCHSDLTMTRQCEWWCAFRLGLALPLALVQALIRALFLYLSGTVREQSLQFFLTSSWVLFLNTLYI